MTHRTPGYKIIYADPPWQYGSQGPRGGKFGKLDYNDMDLDSLCRMDVARISDKDAVCFMWFTASFQQEALDLMQAWGFKPVRIDRVWKKVKTTGGMHAAVGPWGMTDAEFILLGTRGSGLASAQLVTNTRTCAEVAYPGKHSAKPHEFAFEIASRFPSDWKKLEMFARNALPGWDAFGNEAPNSIEIPTKTFTAYAEEIYQQAEKLRKKADRFERLGLRQRQG